MSQAEIINQAVGITNGNPKSKENYGKQKKFLAYLNEGLAPLELPRATFSLWQNGHQKAEPWILLAILRSYPVDDPRHKLAADLLGLRVEA